MEERQIKYRIFSPIDRKFWYWGFINRGEFSGVPTVRGMTLEYCRKHSQQFINCLTDDKQEIWEGDIVQYDALNKIVAEVKFVDGSWCACDCSCNIPLYELGGIRVIGNTSENPEQWDSKHGSSKKEEGKGS